MFQARICPLHQSSRLEVFGIQGLEELPDQEQLDDSGLLGVELVLEEDEVESAILDAAEAIIKAWLKETVLREFRRSDATL